jgi:2-aminoadipate transaminase
VAEYRTSRIARGIKSSHVRDLLQLAQAPDMISMAGGLPSPELFDVTGIAQAAECALRESPAASLQYGMTEGQRSLKEALVEHLGTKGIEATDESLVVTTGSQQALDLMGRVMLDRGDCVVVERPTYLSALQAFDQYEPEILSIGIDAGGGCVQELEKLEGRRPKFVYVVPNFANPSGMCMSRHRREWLVRWAVRNEVFILEDDPYGDLHTGSEPPGSIMSIAQAIPGGRQWCGYTSTLSKCVAPGLRIGWLVLPAELARAVAKVKQAVDLHTSSFVQEVGARYLRSGRLAGRLDAIRAEYGQRRKILESELRMRFGRTLEFTPGDGGIFLWARFTDGTDSSELLRHALERNVMFVPGRLFFADSPDMSALRLNFTGAPKERLRVGAERLFDAHRAYRQHVDARQHEAMKVL